MPKKSNKRSNKRKNTTRKQKTILMIGCSKKNKKSCKNNFLSSKNLRKNKSCPNCGPNCHCGPNCNCPHPCPGNCYLNRRTKKHKGGSGCGSCGCPLAPLSWKEMNQFGGYYGSYPKILEQPVIIHPPSKGEFGDILGVGQNGGMCSACSQVPIQSGGAFFKQTGPMPGPLAGSAWEPNKLPGENGIGGDRNYLKPYNTDADPQQQMTMNGSGYKTLNSMVGGYTYHKKPSSTGESYSKSNKTGGGLVPQDLVNLGRDFTYNFKNAYNTLNGYKAPVDPAPYKDQLTGSLNNNNRFFAM